MFHLITLFMCYEMIQISDRDYPGNEKQRGSKFMQKNLKRKAKDAGLRHIQIHMHTHTHTQRKDGKILAQNFNCRLAINFLSAWSQCKEGFNAGCSLDLLFFSWKMNTLVWSPEWLFSSVWQQVAAYFLFVCFNLPYWNRLFMTWSKASGSRKS